MAQRLSRTVINDPLAKAWLFKAKNEGRDTVPLAGNCLRPVLRPFTGMQDALQAHLRRYRVEGRAIINMPTGKPVWISWPKGSKPSDRVWHVDVMVPCRKCENCLKRRAQHWRLRAQAECSRAQRTWFSTFTLAPEWQWKTLARAIAYQASRGVTWNKLTASERFAAHCTEIYKDFQKYLKRLRKGGSQIRYMIIFERHASGYPHLHALIHETAAPVRHAVLTKEWAMGFTTHKLVDDAFRTSAYVCKYLTKDISNKVRASLKYGTTG